MTNNGVWDLPRRRGLRKYCRLSVQISGKSHVRRGAEPETGPALLALPQPALFLPADAVTRTVIFQVAVRPAANFSTVT